VQGCATSLPLAAHKGVTSTKARTLQPNQSAHIAPRLFRVRFRL
jgi:hypothetical protein